MKSLFLRLFLFSLIATCVMLAFVAMAELCFYRYLIQEDYLSQSEVITEAMVRELRQPTMSEAETIDWWQQASGARIELVNEALSAPRVTRLEATTMEGEIQLQIPFGDTQYLQFDYVDTASSPYQLLFWGTYLLMFLFVALMVALFTRSSYRYLQGMSLAVQRIKDSDYKSQVPGSKLEPLDQLASHINQLSSRLAEQAEQQLVLNGAIGHELRNPLMRLRLALDMASKRNYKDAPEYLPEMDEDLQEMEELSSELIWLVRAQHESEDSVTETVDLSTLLLEVSGRYSDIQRTIAEGIQIKGQTLLVKRAIKNLIENAYKHAKSQVKVVLERQDTKLCLRIDDDGEGISNEDKPKVFIPFYRADKSRSKQLPGFGLGLAIAKLAIEQSGGLIIVSDNEWGGARFEVFWPNANK